MSEPWYADDAVTVYHGDCLDVLPELADASVDAVVTDPPYGLEFMGREWDRLWNKGGDAFSDDKNWGTRPAGYRPRYVQNLKCTTCGLWKRDRNPCTCDVPTWQTPKIPDNGSRFASAMQEWHYRWAAECLRVLKPGGHLLAFGGTRTHHRLACAIEDAGFEIRDSISWIYATGFPKSLNLDGEWKGWGTALKPAHEPIVVARKPLTGTIAANILRHGTGALNIDACRIGTEERVNNAGGSSSLQRVSRVQQGYRNTVTTSSNEDTIVAGRWPPNVVLDEAAAAELDQQSGTLTSGNRKAGTYGLMGYMGADAAPMPEVSGDSGGASRFFPIFRYEPKAPTLERPRIDEIAHPTTKPLELMRWLVRLVTPPGGVILDPFLGSGTTAEAAIIEGFRCVGVEREADYLPLIRVRLTKPIQPVLGGEL